MAISSKTRKTLWARSGNRCAMCRSELVAEENEHDRNLNNGDECHIISEKINGPRHKADYGKNFDKYENLILLCKNHHKTVDELWETYTIELLKTIKSNHENWIKTVIDNAKNKVSSNGQRILNRLTTGKQLVEIINDVSVYQFDHDECNNEEESDFISGFLQNLQDHSEASVFGSYEIGDQIKLGFKLNKEIEELESRGFFIFGERKKSRLSNAINTDLGIWNVAVLVVLRKNNPQIINVDKLTV